MTTPWTTNLCPNPNFLSGLTGYTPIQSSTTLTRVTTSVSGAGMLVETAGNVTGEGFVGPDGLVPYITTGSASLYLMGTTEGSLVVSVAASPGSSALATVPVTLSVGSFTQVVLNGLSLLEGQEMYVIVSTAFAQQLSFYVSAVQYEPESPGHPYIDGNSPFCQWTGTPNASSSLQQYQNPDGAYGSMLLDGKPVAVVASGQHFTAGIQQTGLMTLVGANTSSVAQNPAAAFSDFAAFQSADLDPAQTYVSWNNAGTSSGQTGYNQIYGLFYPPSDYPVSTTASTGVNLWNHAQYMAAGWQFASLAAGQQQDLADVMVTRKIFNYLGTPVPASYSNPRQVQAIVEPTRLNFCPNPSTAVSTSGWTATYTATLAQDNTVSAQTQAGTLDASSMKVTVNASGDGTYITLANLITGDEYAVSAWVQGGAHLLDVQITCSGTVASSALAGVPYGGGSYGGGYYGGSAPAADMVLGQWYNPQFTFTAINSSVQLWFQSIVDASPVYPTTFWIDAIMVEHGASTGSYFDGGFGTDYSWENGGTAGLTRSYYYQRQKAATGSVNSVLAQHTPYGISASAPQFSIPYTQ